MSESPLLEKLNKAKKVLLSNLKSIDLPRSIAKMYTEDHLAFNYTKETKGFPLPIGDCVKNPSAWDGRLEKSATKSGSKKRPISVRGQENTQNY